MNKKEILLKLFEGLEGKWEEAGGIKLLIEKGYIGNEEMDGLIEFFNEAIKNTNDERLKNKLQEGLNIIKRIKILEEQNKEIEEKELEDLEKRINELF